MYISYVYIYIYNMYICIYIYHYVKPKNYFLIETIKSRGQLIAQDNEIVFNY